MNLIVGLGNPGPKYALTRHNIGFMAIDGLARFWGADTQAFKSEHKALTLKLRVDDHMVMLAKPQTYMNLSGESLQSLMSFYQVPPENLLVVHDEVDLPFGTLKFQKNRGHGGHNGIRNIHQMLSTNTYDRLRLGVGRSTNPAIETADHVLQNFSKVEMEQLPDFLSLACEGIDAYIEMGFDKAANQFNNSSQRNEK